jgi:hypothetical protein
VLSITLPHKVFENSYRFLKHWHTLDSVTPLKKLKKNETLVVEVSIFKGPSAARRGDDERTNMQQIFHAFKRNELFF